MALLHTGTGLLVLSFFYMTFVTADRPLWWALIGMFGVGLGLGQLMQTLTIASQNSVDVRYMGVATSSSTFFRQIGGTVGTAALLSVLFARIPDTVASAFQDRTVLRNALDAALNPAVADLPQNRGIMRTIYSPIVDRITAGLPAGVDLSNATVRGQIVDQAVSQSSGTTVGGGMTNALDGDTSFLTSASRALKEPFLMGFADAMATVFWVGLAVVAVAFLLSWFLKATPLRAKSALQEAADAAKAAGAMVAPGSPAQQVPGASGSPQSPQTGRAVPS